MATGAEPNPRSPQPTLAPRRGPHALAASAAPAAPAPTPAAPAAPIGLPPRSSTRSLASAGHKRPRASARPSPFTCSIARPGTQLNRLRPLRVPNRTRRLLEPTRSCRDPQIPPLPLWLTGRAPLGVFLSFSTIGLKSSPSSLLLSHWTIWRTLPPPHLGIGRSPKSSAHHKLYDWREGQTSAISDWSLGPPIVAALAAPIGPVLSGNFHLSHWADGLHDGTAFRF